MELISKGIRNLWGFRIKQWIGAEISKEFIAQRQIKDS